MNNTKEKNTLYIIDMCHNHSLLSFMKYTKKYRELWHCESIVSFIIAVVMTVTFWYSSSIDAVNDVLRSLFELTVPAYIGIIGFLFSGLALMSAIISYKALKVIDEKGHILAVVGILYSFYYCGAIIAGGLLMDGIFYMLFSFYSLNIYCSFLYWMCVFLVIYLTIYALLYAVSLLGSCIKFFFVNVYYENFDELNSK